jgi:CheY-like chemotaxis protein
MATPETSHRPAVLVVDDEPLALRMMERVLREAGYQVYPVSNPIEALEIATRMPVRPALMVTALLLEPISGLDLARLVGGSHSGTRVLFVAAPGGADMLPASAGPTLYKPLTDTKLIESVQRLLAEPVASAPPSLPQASPR